MTNSTLIKKSGKIKKTDRSDRFRALMDAFPSTRTLVLGDFILDEFVWGKVSRISPEAPVPVVDIQRQSFQPGGALNVANNIRVLDGTVFPCGAVGKDLHGRMLLKKVREAGIDSGGVFYDKHRPTTLKTRVVAHSQQVVRFDRERSDDLSREATQHILDFVQKKIASAQALIIEDYGKGVITPTLLASVGAMARKHNVITIVDPKDKHFDYYRGMRVITPNLREAVAAAKQRADEGFLPLEEVGARLLKRFECEAVVVTLGEEGMCVFEAGGAMTKIPTAAREVFDVSGAGDTVVAVIAMALAAGATMKEAAELANYGAGIVVGKLGTATITRDELREAIT